MSDETRERTDRVLLVAGTVACFALHLWLSSHISTPTVVFDENGYLGNARWMAGGARWDMPFAPTYAAGYSLLIAPAMAVFHTAGAQWQAVLVVNALLLCTVFPLVTAMLRRIFAIPRRRAMAAAAVAALTPAVVATGISAVAENLVLPMVPATLLAAWAMTDPAGRLRSRIWFGPAVAVLYAAHPRFTLAVPLALVLLAWLGTSRRVDRRAAAANAVLLVTGAVLVRVLDAAVWSARWDRVERLEGSAGTWWSLVTSGSGLGELAMTAVGQAWYLVIGSVGLVAVGVAVLVRRATAPAAGWGPDHPLVERRRAVVGFALVLGGAVFATSVLFFAQNQFRADHYVYGRHNDSFTPVWVAVALAYLFDRVGGRRPIALLGATAGLAAALSAVLVATRDPADQYDVFSPFAVAAVIRFVGSDPGGTFVRASLWGLAGIGTITLLVWLSRRAGPPTWLAAAARPVLAIGLGSWFLFAGYGVVHGTQDFVTLNYEGWTPVSTISRLGVDELCIDVSAVRGRATLSYPWHLPQVDVTTYDAKAGEQPGCPYAIARLDDLDRRSAGDRVAVLDQGGLYGLWDAPKGLALWVRPGDAQDDLAARGALLPAGFPGPIPATARAASVVLADPARRSVTVESGGRARVAVRVRHEGTGAPWPDLASYALAGHVRVVAEVTPLDPGGVIGARSGGELPRWMLPGDRARVDAEIVAVDQVLAPLPPGRYRVRLGIAQAGEDWFTPGGSGATFTLVVTPKR